jgi:hypothetical protein
VYFLFVIIQFNNQINYSKFEKIWGGICPLVPPNYACEDPGCGPPPHLNRNLNYTDFVDTRISKALRDLPFNRNQPLKSAGDQCIRIFINKIIQGVLDEIKRRIKLDVVIYIR